MRPKESVRARADQGRPSFAVRNRARTSAHGAGSHAGITIESSQSSLRDPIRIDVATADPTRETGRFRQRDSAITVAQQEQDHRLRPGWIREQLIATALELVDHRKFVVWH